jgi:hypothetical protein
VKNISIPKVSPTVLPGEGSIRPNEPLPSSASAKSCPRRPPII